MVNFNQNLYVEEHNFVREGQVQEEKKKKPGTGNGDIPTSADISGIEVRLSRVLIEDNNTPSFLFLPGRTNVYFLNLVVSDLSKDQLKIDLRGFEKVDDGDSLNVDKTLFFWKKTTASAQPPSQVHVMCSLIKSKQGLRQAGDILAKVKGDPQYKTFVEELGAMVRSANPVTEISNVVFSIAAIVGKYLGRVEDRPLLTWFQSFTDVGGDMDKTGKTVKEAANKYASMRLTLYLRDKERQAEEERENQPEKD
jgi:hypothetical protein